MKKMPVSKKHSLFDPDQILTEIHQAMSRDFSTLKQMYRGIDNGLLFASNRQLRDFRKKYCSKDQDRDHLEAQTFETFLKVNEHMSSVNDRLVLSLPPKGSRIQMETPYMDRIHLRAKALVAFVLGSFDEDEWFKECRNSSGSSLGVSFSATSQEKKFTFPMSITKSAEVFYKRCMLFNFKLEEAIMKYNSENLTDSPYRFVEASRATTVDKTTEKRRFICVEPTCNMFLQQGLMHMMYKRLRSVNLDVEILPQVHRREAWLASISGLNATIDLSSASDCVSTELLRWLLPSRWFSVIDAVRSTHTSINGSLVKLQMISTMGNAVTFPLETLVFWAYAQATLLSESRTLSLFPEWKDLTRCSVFGDDCIVPTSIATKFISNIEAIGFIVNWGKTHIEKTDRFRESCGADYLAGYDVRPYYITAPRSQRYSSLEPWLYIIANSLQKKYISYFGSLNYVYDKELWRTIFSVAERYKLKLKLVPDYFPDDSGLKISQDITRFRASYSFVLDSIKRSCHGTYSFNYCRFVYRVKEPWDDGIRLQLWLRSPSQSRTPHVHTSPNRRIGGYVVAKGISCHWHLPLIR